MLKNLASMSSLNLFKAGVQFAITTLAAFYVLPQAYGLVTFSLPIIQFIALFTDMGLASAVIRQPLLSREDAGAAMSFSVVVALIAGTLLAAAAWPIEYWSGLPNLASVLVALAGAVVFTIVASLPRALLERALRYQRVAAIEGVGTVIAGAICIAALMLDAGIWAIVAFHVMLQGFRASAFLWTARGDLVWNVRWARVAGLLSFGGWVLATNIINFLARNAQNILIGVWIGAAAVGLYGMAYQFMILPLMAMAWPASGVLMATLSRLGETDRTQYRAPVLAVTTITALIAFPVMTYMTFGLAWPIAALLSPNWLALVPLLATLAPLGALQSLAAYNGAVLIARGHARLQFYVNVISSVLLLTGFIVSLPFGLQVFARTYLAVGAMVALGQIAAKLWAAEVDVKSYVRALLPAIAATLAGLAAAVLVGWKPTHWGEWLLVTGAYVGGVVGVFVLLRRQILKAVRNLLDGGGRVVVAADAVPDRPVPGSTVTQGVL